ncbi:macrolide transport system ATP-binding/permease protein [Rhizobium sp. SG_E_25_P2]|uniref:MacB family efflux pump subunit n=1 Tax=Rhizobium sp. SG_E_25_P2 TaxID=2879942 RepID=UPI002474E8BE|nr:MacB family efflux pump subunit [Rhizobium sp. SG_E_25_P2]MDH6264810.1 macrolide transport system ATP-binding/permease protein [Rhizobium sp. SG_E_25_P2]
MADPLISLRKVRREFPAGEDVITVLEDVDLEIASGEFVAIIGPSGSGKSTLMNILGCLDRPSGGDYRIGGRLTSDLDPDELAQLRREHFGFIFQRYHLLGELTALSNAEIPAIYSGMSASERRSRAKAMLERLGMGERLTHRPGQLSGGQQQRVSIARALINGADVILADEPTGALDTKTGEEMLKILEELNAEGHTVIIVTHDMAVARRAHRVVEISDGRIVADRRTEAAARKPVSASDPVSRRKAASGNAVMAGFDRFGEAFRMALIAMNAHRLRTFLTMLGIIIGIASVVSVVAIGAGSQKIVLEEISRLGANTLEIFPGKNFGDVRSEKVQTLVLADAEALAAQPYAAGVTPTVTKSLTLRRGSQEASALVNGVGPGFFSVRNASLASGRFFDASSVDTLAQDVVIDDNTRKTLFSDEDAVGQILLVGSVPCRIIGVIEPQEQSFGGSGNLNVYLPFSTVQARMTGETSLRSILLKVADDANTTLAEQAATEFLTARHGSKDFFIFNTDQIRQTITATAQTLTLLVAAIAVISLVVGGIGVMNIMLVSVSERVQEIGVRMAVGARRSDILQQFLTEAVLVCFVGGFLGVATAFGLGGLVSLLTDKFAFIYSTPSIIGAFVVSTLIGILFGFLPARNASRLDPVVALSRA